VQNVSGGAAWWCNIGVSIPARQVMIVGNIRYNRRLLSETAFFVIDLLLTLRLVAFITAPVRDDDPDRENYFYADL
jgi:hypothetical protein